MAMQTSWFLELQILERSLQGWQKYITNLTVPDMKGPGQPAFPGVQKKYEERVE
jgi:hypothetical protein